MRWLSFKKKKPNLTPRNDKVVFDDNYIKEFVIQWSLTFPIDRWWRERHKIAFNSQSHREVSFLDMRFEFEEYILNSKTIEFSLYKPDKGDYIKPIDDFGEIKDENKEFEDEFNNTDLSQFDD